MDPKAVQRMQQAHLLMHLAMEKLNMQYLQLLLRCGVQDPVLHRF